MIDRTLLREQPDFFISAVKRKDPEFPAEKLIELDQQVRKIQSHVEELRAERNSLAKAGKSGVTQELRSRSIELGKELKRQEEALEETETLFRDLYLFCPNLPAQELPDGGKEANFVVREVGVKPHFSFAPKTHVELGEALGWLDFAAAARMTKSHFALYRGKGVMLQYALSMLMLSTARSFGYEPVLPPYLINEQALEGASNFPRFRQEVFAIEKDGLFLTPTAEVNLANLYRDTIIEADDLPVRLTALTSCFRREAGGYGASERGLIRIHQFDKVELFSLTKPEDSPSEQERMLSCAESILKKLGLHYRVVLLAAQDCSFASTKTYDIEVWMPGQNEYKEVSSISNCADFQARRCATRYREKAGEKTQLVHTLNGSSLALPRLFVALLESGQQADGSIVLPPVLKEIIISA
ncbi:MAG: serine--tRNA ligase [Candidatus Babeliaceae bacterium]|nr:serine--tRNA ligase [Candidatus Babeliaceae bacterium]